MMTPDLWAQVYNRQYCRQALFFTFLDILPKYWIGARSKARRLFAPALLSRHTLTFKGHDGPEKCFWKNFAAAAALI